MNAAGATLFTRSDMEEGHWVQEEMTVNAVFPYDPAKVIQRGQRIAFRDPATDVLQVFEIRSVSTHEPDAYQQITAEHIAIAELQDEHVNSGQITEKTASQALSALLSGTLWQVGTDNTSSGTQSADISRGSVWQAVCTVAQNWNVYITPRVVISAAGAITGKYLDIMPAGGTWSGLRLSIHKNLYDPVVTYNDEDVLTALYGYGGSVDGETELQELTFADEVWTATSAHPAKPSGQTYLEWPEKTALYGRNGRPRFGYYQNAAITDPNVLLEKTWEALKRTCDPKISISGTCADLHRLGYADEPLKLHALALVEVEETGESFYKEIIRLDVDLVDPTGSRPEIGDYIPNIIYINRETAKKASGGGGGGNRGMTETNDEIVRIYQRFKNDEEGIGMVVGYGNGQWEVEAGRIVLAINETGTPGSYESAAYINADHINISGTATAYTLAGAMHIDATGKLIIDNAGGMYVERTEQGVTAQFGVFDSGNLTGGVIVNKVNGSTGTYITGDHVNISATGTAQTLSAAMELDASGNLVIKEGAGLYAQHTVGGSIAKFGVFDNNTLTGGVIVTKVNGETGACVNADHVNISATSTVKVLSDEMEVDANGKMVVKSSGGLYVERQSGGQTVTLGVWDRGNLTGGVMVTQINGQSSLKLSADVIDINGIVAKLSALNISALQISGTSISGSVAVSAPLGGFNNLGVDTAFTFLNKAVSWKSKTVITEVTVSKTTQHRWLYLDNTGTEQTNNTTMVTNVTKSAATINYLGKADS